MVRSCKLSTASEWCLRCVVLIQCLGVGGRYLFSQYELESDVYAFLFFDCQWSEALAQRIDDLGAFVTMVAGIVVLLGGLIPNASSDDGKPYRLYRALESTALVVIAAWMMAIATTYMVRGERYAEYAWGEHAVRIVAPIALLAVQLNFARAVIAMLTIAASATFAVHGLKALWHFAPFVDLVLLTDQRFLHWELRQASAERLLTCIGWQDIVLAGLIVSRRWRGVALYMAIWGLLTALSRVTAMGSGAWPEVLLRAANSGVPLALFLYLSKQNSRTKQLTENPK